MLTITNNHYALAKLALLIVAMLATSVATAAKLTKASQLLAQGKETLAAIGLKDVEIRLDNIKSIMADCIERSHDPMPIAYSAMASVQDEAYQGFNAFQEVQREGRLVYATSNLYRALRALDREYDTDYAYSFLQLAIEQHAGLDFDKVYRHTYLDAMLDIAYPNQTTEADRLFGKPDLHFYEETESIPLNREAELLQPFEVVTFFGVGKVREEFVATGILPNLDSTLEKILTHYDLPPEDEAIFTGLVASLRSHTAKHLRKQEAGKSYTIKNSRRDALTSILAKDPDKSLVNHEATLSYFATGEFVKGRKPLRMRSLSRLYALVEQFRDYPQIYQELRWQYLRVYQHSLNISRAANASARELQDLDVTYDGLPTGILNEADIRDLRRNLDELPPNDSRAGSVTNHPNVEQIKRHYYLEQLVDLVVEERLRNAGSSYSAAREYALKYNLLGINAKERRAYVYNGIIPVAAVKRLKSNLKSLSLAASQADALEQIVAASVVTNKTALANLAATTVKAIDDAITTANVVYNEGDNKVALFRTVSAFSNLRREIEDGKVDAETIAQAREVIQDLTTKVSDVEAEGLAQILKNIEL
ncbi:MAG: hypothetical protein OYH77_00510 [Pseudomonadota bacterium]|nr:hypothetical protein [Pseudomonadota bacterium]